MALQAIAEQLWLADGPNVDFYGFPYSTRMLVARLPDDQLWVWSPIALDDALRKQIDALGKVTWLVSPNKIHHLFMGAWQQSYPRAQLCGPTQLVEKRDDLLFAVRLDDGPPPAWVGIIEQVVMRGSVAMDEIEFFHRPSRTLIIGDLIENFEQEFLFANWKPWQIRLARFAGITAPDGRAPLDFRLSFVRRKAAREAAAKMLSWAPERVIMAHGRWIDEDATGFLERALAWLHPPPR